MKWFILICYIWFSYGVCYMVTSSHGPKNIFEKLRDWAESVGTNFGMLFRCMICFPTNFGILFSLFNWFLLPELSITPFNLIFSEYNFEWYYSFLGAFLDGCFTGGICKVIYNVDDYIDKSTPIFEDEVKHFRLEKNDGEGDE